MDDHWSYKGTGASGEQGEGVHGQRQTSGLLATSRKSLGDQIYARMREQIVHLQLVPGQMIYENEIAERLHVSRTPVREAFRLLANEALIDIMPQRGTRISLISVQKVAEARFIREQLEIEAFRMAASLWNERIAAVHERKLVDLLHRQRAAVGQKDVAGLLSLDEAFHEAVMFTLGNETLLQVIGQMRAHLNRVRYLSLLADHQMDEIVKEHELLFESIREGDVAGTAAVLTKHFRKLDIHLPKLRAEYPQYFCD